MLMIDNAKKIKEYCEVKFLTQEDLAKIFSVSSITISRWESGKFEPTMQMKKKLYSLFEEAGIIKNERL